MNVVVDRLIAAYREELACYEEVLALSREGVRLAREHRGLEELNHLAAHKRASLGRVETIESSIAEDKRWWRETGRHELESSSLERLLVEIARCIDGILRAERDAEHLILGLVVHEAAQEAREA